jgi:hypothetical protein
MSHDTQERRERRLCQARREPCSGGCFDHAAAATLLACPEQQTYRYVCSAHHHVMRLVPSTRVLGFAETEVQRTSI